MTEEKLDVILKTLSFLLQDRPQYQGETEYGMSEDAFLVDQIDKLLRGL